MINLYEWQGINATGQRVQDQQAAANSRDLFNQLQNQGIVVINIKKKLLLFGKLQKISLKQLAEFTHQLGILCQANVDLVTALQITVHEEYHTDLEKLIIAIKKNIENGMSLAESLNHFPLFFDKVYCALIEAGEQSGTLGKMLMQLADYQEKMLTLRAKIAKALFYPAAVAVIATLITIGLLIFVVPQFKIIFTSFGAQLPGFTQVVIEISNGLQAHAKKFLILIVMIITSCRYAIRHFAKARTCLDNILLQLPMVGRLLTVAFLARWTRLLATLLRAGLSLVDALRIAGKSISNQKIQRQMDDVIQRVIDGGAFNQALSTHSCFSSRITQMIAVGENTGQLSTMLEKIAEGQQISLDRSIDYFSKWLEPVVMMILAIVTGGLIIAMYLPVFQLGAAL
jgi:type IV pilus assembly protein PilC